MRCYNMAYNFFMVYVLNPSCFSFHFTVTQFNSKMTDIEPNIPFNIMYTKIILNYQDDTIQQAETNMLTEEKTRFNPYCNRSGCSTKLLVL